MDENIIKMPKVLQDIQDKICAIFKFSNKDIFINIDLNARTVEYKNSKFEKVWYFEMPENYFRNITKILSDLKDDLYKCYNEISELNIHNFNASNCDKYFFVTYANELDKIEFCFNQATKIENKTYIKTELLCNYITFSIISEIEDYMFDVIAKEHYFGGYMFNETGGYDQIFNMQVVKENLGKFLDYVDKVNAGQSNVCIEKTSLAPTFLSKIAGVYTDGFRNYLQPYKRALETFYPTKKEKLKNIYNIDVDWINNLTFKEATYYFSTLYNSIGVRMDDDYYEYLIQCGSLVNIIKRIYILIK